MADGVLRLHPAITVPEGRSLVAIKLNDRPLWPSSS